jgi:hypothetical protein
MEIAEIRTTQKHVNELSENIRDADKEEVIAKTGKQDFKKVIVQGWLMADMCKTVLVDNEVAFVYGIVESDHKDIGSPFMLATPLVSKIKIPLIRNCRQRVYEMEQKYKILFNYIDSRNDLHLRFIKWCGFEIINEKIFNNVKFYGFFKGEK